MTVIIEPEALLRHPEESPQQTDDAAWGCSDCPNKVYCVVNGCQK